MNKYLLMRLVMLSFLISACAGESEKIEITKIDSEHFHLEIDKTWVVISTDRNLSRQGLEYEESRFYLDLGALKGAEIIIKSIVDIQDNTYNSATEFWRSNHLITNKDNSESLDIDGFAIMEKKDVLNIDMEDGTVSKYYETNWFVKGVNREFFITYGSYSPNTYREIEPKVLEILGTLKEVQ